MNKFPWARSWMVAAVSVCCSLGVLSNLRAADEVAADADGVKAQLEQAIDLVVAATKTSVAAEKEHNEAVTKVQSAYQAVQAISQMGDLDANAQVTKLANALRDSGRPEIADVIARLQLESKLRNWLRISSKERASTIREYVSSAKAAGVSPEHAATIMRLASMQEMVGEPEPAIEAINELLPEFRKLDEENKGKAAAGRKLKPVAPRLEGIARRMGLVGKPLELEGKLLDGSTFDWNSYRGKVVLIDFHASWCGPCRAEVPNVLENYRAYHDKGFEVVGVNMDTDPKLAQKYIDDTGAKFPTIFSDDPNATGWEAPLATKYGVNAIPRVFLVDKDGNVVSTSARGSTLGKLLQELLGPPAAGDEEKSEEKSKG